MDISNRIESEKHFYDQLYADGWEKQGQHIDENIIPSNMTIYWDVVKNHVNRLKGKETKPVVLDCGCGHGVLSVMVAKQDARVVAVDISYNSTRVTRELAEVNKVEDNVLVVVAAMEHLPFKENAFDAVLGTRVLHHVDIDCASRELTRVTKAEAGAIFWECTEKNPVLRYLRKNIRKVMRAPKFGTEHEHPLTKAEIAKLETAFGVPTTTLRAPFYFFSLINQYLSRRYKEQLTGLGNKLDALVEKILPGLNRFSFHQILIYKKKQDPENSKNGK